MIFIVILCCVLVTRHEHSGLNHFVRIYLYSNPIVVAFHELPVLLVARRKLTSVQNQNLTCSSLSKRIHSYHVKDTEMQLTGLCVC